MTPPNAATASTLPGQAVADALAEAARELLAPHLRPNAVTPSAITDTDGATPTFPQVTSSLPQGDPDQGPPGGTTI